MFTLAMEAKARGRGVVGSTSDILGFIAQHVRDALEQPFLEPLQVCLCLLVQDSVHCFSIPLQSHSSGILKAYKVHSHQLLALYCIER